MKQKARWYSANQVWILLEGEGDDEKVVAYLYPHGYMQISDSGRMVDCLEPKEYNAVSVDREYLEKRANDLVHGYDNPLVMKEAMKHRWLELLHLSQALGIKLWPLTIEDYVAEKKNNA